MKTPITAAQLMSAIKRKEKAAFAAYLSTKLHGSQAESIAAYEVWARTMQAISAMRDVGQLLEAVDA